MRADHPLQRTITFTNTGTLALNIVKLKFTNNECEESGIKIINCKPFSLSPEESYDLTIHYSPTFSNTYFTKSLTLVTERDRDFKFDLKVKMPVKNMYGESDLFFVLLNKSLGIRVILGFIIIVFTIFWLKMVTGIRLRKRKIPKFRLKAIEPMLSDLRLLFFGLMQLDYNEYAKIIA